MGEREREVRGAREGGGGQVRVAALGGERLGVVGDDDEEEDDEDVGDHRRAEHRLRERPVGTLLNHYRDR